MQRHVSNQSRFFSTISLRSSLWPPARRPRLSASTIKLEYLNHCLNEAVGQDAIIVNEYWARQEFCPREKAGTFYGSSPAGGLGWGSGAALGAKLALLGEGPLRSDIEALRDERIIMPGYVRNRAELEAIAAATTLPIVLGGAPEEMSALDYLTAQRVRIALQGHAPFAAATQAVYETLKALREGASPKSLKGLASAELTGRAMREADTKKRSAEFLGLKK